MRGRVDPQRHPARLLDRDVERDAFDVAVGGDLGLGDREAVDDDLDGDFPRLAEAGALEVPVRLLDRAAGRAIARAVGRDVGFETGRDLRGDLDRGRPASFSSLPCSPSATVVDPEIDQVAVAVARRTTGLA